jgi:hypothetical protein
MATVAGVIDAITERPLDFIAYLPPIGPRQRDRNGHDTDREQ